MFRRMVAMKKNYEAPVVELVKFNYADQVVAASDCWIRVYGNESDAVRGCNPVGYTK